MGVGVPAGPAGNFEDTTGRRCALAEALDRLADIAWNVEDAAGRRFAWE